MYRSAHSSSKVSKDGDLSTPYAPRPFKARPAMGTDYPEALHRTMAWRHDYYSLSDPHLAHYFRRKLIERPQSRAFSSLSFRTQSSNMSNRSSASLSQHDPPPQSTYKIVVKTGAAPDAGTCSRAFITLQGSKGTLKRRRLAKNSRAEFSFLPGKSAAFRVRGKDVGELTHVAIETAGLKKTDSWFVESVSVADEKGGKWLCPCNQWLSLFHSDCQLSRTLKAHPYTGKTSQACSPVFMLEVHTGDVRGAGTSANVFVSLEGTRGSSSKQRIRGSPGGFERGSVVRGEVRCQNDIGQVKRITIGHDNSGFGSDWFLEQVVLYPQSDPQDKVYFVCGQWLSRTQGDGEIERTLGASLTPTTQLPQRCYLVEVVTGAMRGAGTGANVFITLFGEKGTSGEKPLDNDPANFERGRKDTFSVYCGDLGALTKILLRHDNTGIGASWFLERVEVIEKLRGGEDRRPVRFPCGRWLEECEGCGGDLEVELTPEGSPGPKRRQEKVIHMYKVSVRTGRRPGAGTSANVHIVLCDKDGRDSGKLQLENQHRTLAPGQTDCFEVTTSKLLSPVESVSIGQDNTGASPGWFLEEVVVECCTTGGRWTFPCHQWLCVDTGDGRAQRELHPLVPDDMYSKHSLPWQICVLTSDLRGAGTDANVTIQVHGNEGSSDPIPLGDNIANFEQGERDVFRGILLPTSIGDSIEAVTVSHDGANPYPEWHLEGVELHNHGLQLEYHCHCGSWLSAENSNSVRLTAVPSKPASQHSSANGSHTPSINGHTPLTNGHPPTSNGHTLITADGHTPITANSHLPSSRPSITLSLTNDPTSLTNGSPPTSGPTSKTSARLLSPNAPTSSLSLSSNRHKTIPYTVHIVGGAPPTSSHTPILELLLYGEGGDSHTISLEPLGTRPTPGTPETYSVEGANVGDITHIKARLVGSSGVSWLVDEITIHSPTSGHTHHFPLGYTLMAGGEEHVVKATEVLESSFNTSTMVSTPRASASSELIAYEVKVSTADKKNAGTTNSLYMVLVGTQLSSKLFTFKNSSRSPILQRGQSDTFQVATPPLGDLKAISVAHCPRRKHRGAESAPPEASGKWFLFQTTLTNLKNKTKACFLCRQWVESSPSPKELNFTEIPISDNS